MLEINKFKKAGYKKITAIDLVSINPLVVKVMDMHQMSFNDNSFDLIYCSGTFHCSYNPKRLVKEFVRVIRNSGAIFITVPVKFKKNKIYQFDVKSLGNLHNMFKKNIKKIFWSKLLKPGDKNNPNNDFLIRSFFEVKK